MTWISNHKNQHKKVLWEWHYSFPLLRPHEHGHFWPFFTIKSQGIEQTKTMILFWRFYGVATMTRDVSTGATSATAVAPKFSDTLALFQPRGAMARSHLNFPRGYVTVNLMQKMTSMTPSIYEIIHLVFFKKFAQNFRLFQGFRQAYIMSGPFRYIPSICNQRSLT